MKQDFKQSEWVYELSSGFHGYRNTETKEWIYATEYDRRKNKSAKPLLPAPGKSPQEVAEYQLKIILTGLKQIYRVDFITGFYEEGLPFNQEDKYDYIKYWQRALGLLVNTTAFFWVNNFQEVLTQIFEATQEFKDDDAKLKTWLVDYVAAIHSEAAELHHNIQTNCHVYEAEMETHYGI